MPAAPKNFGVEHAFNTSPDGINPLSFGKRSQLLNCPRNPPGRNRRRCFQEKLVIDLNRAPFHGDGLDFTKREPARLLGGPPIRINAGGSEGENTGRGERDWKLMSNKDSSEGWQG